jgi:hypothetical protein
MYDSIECVYCGATVPDRGDGPPPAVDDAAAWRDLREEHAEDCEWITTRAHRIDPTASAGRTEETAEV